MFPRGEILSRGTFPCSELMTVNLPVKVARDRIGLSVKPLKGRIKRLVGAKTTAIEKNGPFRW